MKKNIFAIALIAITFCMASCQKEPVTPNGNNEGTPRVAVTSDLIGTDWTANLSLGDLIYAMTGMTLSDYGCQFPEGFDTTMVFHLNFDNEYAHITFSDNISIINVVEWPEAIPTRKSRIWILLTFMMAALTLVP